MKREYPFGSMFAENDARPGSKNGENYTLSSGTYPLPKTSKCPPPPGQNSASHVQRLSQVFKRNFAQGNRFSQSIITEAQMS